MKMLIFACLAGLVLSPSAAWAADTELTAKEFTGDVVLKAHYGYLLALPEGYDASAEKRWPLIMFLHGAGERGSNLEALKLHGPPKLINKGRKFPAIVVSPQCPKDEIWNPHLVKALVDHVCGQFHVDSHRIYLTGLSMGGFATWDTATEYPETFAALVPICGGAGVRFLLADKIKNIPTWIFHGGKDAVVDPAFSIKIHDVLKKKGADVHLTIYPEAAHDSWTQAYNEEAMWEWLFKQKR